MALTLHCTRHGGGPGSDAVQFATRKPGASKQSRCESQNLTQPLQWSHSMSRQAYRKQSQQMDTALARNTTSDRNMGPKALWMVSTRSGRAWAWHCAELPGLRTLAARSSSTDHQTFMGSSHRLVVPSWHVASSVRRSCDTHLLGVHLERGGCHFLRACVHVLT